MNLIHLPIVQMKRATIIFNQSTNLASPSWVNTTLAVPGRGQTISVVNSKTRVWHQVLGRTKQYSQAESKRQNETNHFKKGLCVEVGHICLATNLFVAAGGLALNS